jgi:class 3 adenylate cyclase
VKSIAASLKTTPAAVSGDIEKLFLKLAQEASAGTRGALQNLRMLHHAITHAKEQGESLSRLLPGGVAEKVLSSGGRIGETEKLTVTVLMSDVRGYSTIAENADPSVLAGQINEHRAAMNRAVIDQVGTVMQFVGDAVMAVFGAPLAQPDHAERALRAAIAMHQAQAELNQHWLQSRLPEFQLGIGLSTGEVAAALLGSEERLEYSVVGDAVNLAQRLQSMAEAGQVVCSEPTYKALSAAPHAECLEGQMVKGRVTPITAYRFDSSAAAELRA